MLRLDNQQAVLEVGDDGPGIPAEHASHVFERFYRADAARSRDAGGSGLGLAIVASTIHAHGGRVYVETTAGSGAVFRAHLPCRPDAEPPADSTNGVPHPATAGDAATR